MAEDVREVRTKTVTLTPRANGVRIEKHGLGGLWQGGAWKGAREIAYSQISGVEWRDAGRIKEGYLQILHAAGSHGRDAYHDENAAIFARRNQPQFEEARAELDRRIQAARAGGGIASVARWEAVGTDP